MKRFKVYNLTDSAAEIIIYGDIGDSWSDESIQAKTFVEELQAIKVETLTVRINSHGGSVADGIAIYNALRRHPARVEVHIDGAAVSIASLIAMAGDSISMAENALLMIHAPWGMASGNARDMDEMSVMLGIHADAMTSAYASRLDETEAKRLLTDGEDHWFTAPEALEAGLIDSITPGLAVAAQLDLSRYPNLPEGANIMTKPNPKPAASATPEPQAGIQAIQARNDQLKTLRVVAGDKPQIQALIDEAMADTSMTLEQVQAKIKTAMEDPAQQPIAGDRGAYAQPGLDESDQRRSAMVQATLARAGIDKADTANPYRGLRLHEMARACLVASGASLAGKSGIEVVEAALSRFPVYGAQTTSDFPILLENTLHKMLLNGYTLQPDSWSQFCKVGSVSDFKDWNRYKTGVLGDLLDVNEKGEYQNINVPDGEKEIVRAKRHGAIISVTPELIVNDDLGALQDLAVGLGRSAQRTVEKRVFVYLLSNPVLSDGVALFHATHGNLASTGAAPTVENIDEARQAMAQQKDVSDNDYLDIRPSLWLGPVNLGGAAREINSAEYNVDMGSTRAKNELTPNRVRGLFAQVVDTPRLSGTAWYMFANPSEGYGVLEVVFLDGQREPRIVQEENFRTGGLSWRAELPFGVAAIDYRGAYQNPGA